MEEKNDGRFKRTWTDEDLIEAVVGCKNYRQVILNLNLAYGGFAVRSIKHHMKRLGLKLSKPEIPEGFKLCNACREIKLNIEFYQGKTNYYSCIECTRAKSREWDKINKDKILWNKYKITIEDYYRILDSQEGGCYICGKEPTEKFLQIDHDHSCCSGKTSCGKCVRGLLCVTCNAGIGNLRDDIQLLDRAKEYLLRGVAE